jgi:formylmethanofuran dehydrogenase subunit E
MSDTAMFPESSVLRLYDPLGDMLGAGDGLFEYTFDDAVKLSGHACPTVAGAFLVAKKAIMTLFETDIAQRGDIQVTVHGALDEGTNGPFSQVLTLLTGAAGDNGFQGLSGHQKRQGLLTFDTSGKHSKLCYTFTRISDRKSVTLAYDASAIAGSPSIAEDMQLLFSGHADETTLKRFRSAWSERVRHILEDDGESTVTQIN